MLKTNVYNMSGKLVGEIELPEAVFGIDPNGAVVHEVVKNHLANLRQGTQSALTRAEVSGGGIKPWRQKGTGRARQGSIRAPQWRGGGVVFGPTPRDHSFNMNKKEIKLAMRSALSAKLADNELVVVDKFDFANPKTKDAVACIKALGLDGKRVTVVLTDVEIESALSFRNLPKVTVLFDHEIDTYFMLDNNALVLAQPVATRLGEELA